MKITFCGAAREVTGSCYLVETDGTRVLVDCGMYQGESLSNKKNETDFTFDPRTIDAVFLTHAHLDHSGRIPKLVKEGFRGLIYATAPTAKLAELVLMDAEHIMVDDHERAQTPILYNVEDVEQAVRQFRAIEYGEQVTIGNLMCTPHDAGHIFGSAFWLIRVSDGPSAIFSGDLGNLGSNILRPTERLPAVDALVIESTYGNRIHEDERTRESQLKAILERTVKENGVLVIPAFSIDRTQQILYELNHLVEKMLIPPIDMYLDSPMAIKATDVMKEYPQYYNPAALALVSHGDDLFDFPRLRLTRTREESKTINDAPKPKVIIAGSGMMNGGRIQHHLVRYLREKNSTVLIVGYQAEGTLGRDLHDGKRRVRVLDETVAVKATITSIGAYSAHADQARLVAWVGEGERVPQRIFCTHGEEGAAVALATRLSQHFHVDATAPHPGDVVTL